MACLRCGSAWTTRWGHDKLSCPECCKQQRAKARKLGKIPASATKTCERCGVAFEAVGGNALRHSKNCEACKVAARKQWAANYKAEVEAGLRSPATKNRPEKPKDLNCQWCNKTLDGKHQLKYCSKKCFLDARKAGKQAWDRTNQLSANSRRVGVSFFPSQLGIRSVLSGFSGFIANLRAFQKRIARLYCPTCGAFVERNASPFCSDECSRKFEFETTCHRCGCSTKSKGYMGSGRRTCEACKQAAERKARRAARRKYGKNHRARARHYGVKYVQFPRKMIFERDGYVCQICKKKTLAKVTYRKSDGKIHPRSPTVDCIVAMANGGNYEPSNCQTACFICNSRKSDSGGGQLRLQIADAPE